MTLRLYEPRDEDAVVALWSDVLPDTAPRNDPRAELRRKLGTANERMIVALDGDEVVGTLVTGFDWLVRRLEGVEGIT